MIGLDTNVLVRYLAGDDPTQSPLARALVASLTSQDPGFVSLVALAETAWVLSRKLDRNRMEVALVLERLLETERLHIQEQDLVWRALRQFRSSNADFSDCIIGALGADSGCAVTVTFDRQAAKLPGFRLLSARKPQ